MWIEVSRCNYNFIKGKFTLLVNNVENHQLFMAVVISMRNVCGDRACNHNYSILDEEGFWDPRWPLCGFRKKKIFIGNKQIIDHGNKSNGLQIMLAKCMCVCIFTYIHHETFISLEQLQCQGTCQKCYDEDVIIFFKPLFATLEWITEHFKQATVSCSHTRSGQCHYVTSVFLTFES